MKLSFWLNIHRNRRKILLVLNSHEFQFLQTRKFHINIRIFIGHIFFSHYLTKSYGYPHRIRDVLHSVTRASPRAGYRTLHVYVQVICHYSLPASFIPRGLFTFLCIIRETITYQPHTHQSLSTHLALDQTPKEKKWQHKMR